MSVTAFQSSGAFSQVHFSGFNMSSKQSEALGTSLHNVRSNAFRLCCPMLEEAHRSSQRSVA